MGLRAWTCLGPPDLARALVGCGEQARGSPTPAARVEAAPVVPASGSARGGLPAEATGRMGTPGSGNRRPNSSTGRASR